MFMDIKVCSRHRLPHPYRIVLVCLWLAPISLLLFAMLVANGLRLAMVHPLFILVLMMMGFPAFYVWNEGIDITDAGIRIRMQGWRYRHFEQLDTWQLDTRRDERILKVWDINRQQVVACHAGHLTNLQILLKTLKDQVRYRHWHT